MTDPHLDSPLPTTRFTTLRLHPFNSLPLTLHTPTPDPLLLWARWMVEWGGCPWCRPIADVVVVAWHCSRWFIAVRVGLAIVVACRYAVPGLLGPIGNGSRGCCWCPPTGGSGGGGVAS